MNSALLDCAMPDPRSKTLARTLFVLFLAYIGLQEVAKSEIGRFVYPSITFPTFEWGTRIRDGRAHFIRSEIDVVLVDGRRERITKKQFFGRMPVNQYHTTLGAFFRSPRNLRGSGDEVTRVNLAEVVPEPPNPRLGRLFTLFPAYRAGRLDRWTAPNQASIRDWVRWRCEQMFPSTAVGRVEVLWYEDSRAIGDLAFRQRLIEVVSLPLEETPR